MGVLNLDKNQRLWKSTKQAGYSLDRLSSANQKLVTEFLKDFELGINTPPKKPGPRQPGTLLRLRSFLIGLDRQLNGKNFSRVTKMDLHSLCDKMLKGEIKTSSGKPYKDVPGMVKNIKTFFRWMERTSHIKNGVVSDLSGAAYKRQKPAWVYLTHGQIQDFISSINPTYQAPVYFIYDSGLRPEEALRIRVKDIEFHEDAPAILHVPKYRDDGSKVSKTFARKIKLMHCSNRLQSYIKIQGLKDDDLLIQRSNLMFNRHLKRVAIKLFGAETVTEARGKIKEINMYDIRHWSTIYWLDRYKRTKDLMYRLGWNREDKVFYYTEFLGRRDAIDDEDMVSTEDKNKYERDIEELKRNEGRNLALLKRVSSITQVLLKTIMDDEEVKARVQGQLKEAFEFDVFDKNSTHAFPLSFIQ